MNNISNKKSITKQVITPKNIAYIITSLLIVFLIFLSGNLWQKYNTKVSLAIEIESESEIYLDGDKLIIILKAQVVNETSDYIEVESFESYVKKRIFFLLSTKGEQLDITNFVCSKENENNSLAKGFHRDFNVYLSIPVPERKNEIYTLWDNNNYLLTYEHLLREIDLPEKNVIVEIKTNPKFVDETTVTLFHKH